MDSWGERKVIGFPVTAEGFEAGRGVGSRGCEARSPCCGTVEVLAAATPQFDGIESRKSSGSEQSE
ncbi:MAG: hypothetical protein EAZ61_02175 [Oscillatoriales cyanobacterium]|nr:MAG: hypothetical protein EAZ61_02175 [Oscillatoriales cyanobacterium]